MMYRKMLNEKQRIQKKIQENQKMIDELPEGAFYSVKNGPWVKWYQNIDGNCTYIPKSNQLHAARLAYKRYLLAEKRELEQKLDAIEAYLKKYPTKLPTKKLLDDPAYQPLLQVFFKPQNQELADWARAPFEQNLYRPENKIHQVCPGLSVRSKSEAMIASRLHTHKIPFRYECVLYINGRRIYPDFTIRHPETGEYYIWEHLGLLEDPAYSQRAGEKITQYANGGIYINRNLIITDEEKQKPLSFGEIDKVIQDYFLAA